MSWEYRWFKEESPIGSYFTLRDVYYRDGKIEAWEKEGVSPVFPSKENAKQSLNSALAALDKEILVESELIEKLKKR